MLTYEEFINESVNHYDSFYIKIVSRKMPEQAIEMLERDPMLRSFRDEYGWEVWDDRANIVKVHLKNPENEATIRRKVKGKHPQLKYVLHELGDPIEGIKATEKEKEKLKFLTKSHFIDKKDIDDIFLGIFGLFTGEQSWAIKYIPEWDQAIKDEYKSMTGNYPMSGDINMIHATLALKDKSPHNENMVKKGFEIILKAIENGDLDIDPNWIKSLKVVKRFNIF